MRLVAVAVLALLPVFSVPAWAQHDALLGAWEAGDRAHSAIYGFIKIDSDKLYFSRDRVTWNCETSYAVESAGAGIDYPGQFPQASDTSGSRTWVWWKLELGKSDCTKSDHFVFAMPDFSTDYLDFADLVSNRTTGAGHFHRTTVVEQPDPEGIPGRSQDEQVAFLNSMSGDSPNRLKYLNLALASNSVEVRSAGAYALRTNLQENIPVLLSIIANDPAHGVRLSAALNFGCQFTCNGVDYTVDDVRVLERNMTLVEAAVRSSTGGRYVVEALDAVWCELTEAGRVRLTTFLASDLSYDDAREGTKAIARDVLSRHANESCSKGE